jgi:hypothetical protein
MSPQSRDGEHRGWPNYLLWGRMRTSTFVLIVAFLATWWLYDTYRPSPVGGTTPETQVVPPGFVPDPSYTWVPRTYVSTPTTTKTTTPTPTTTETTSPEPSEPTETSPGETPTNGTVATTPTVTAPAPTTTPVPPTPLQPGQTPQTTAEDHSGRVPTSPTPPYPVAPVGPAQGAPAA